MAAAIVSLAIIGILLASLTFSRTAGVRHEGSLQSAAATDASPESHDAREKRLQHIADRSSGRTNFREYRNHPVLRTCGSAVCARTQGRHRIYGGAQVQRLSFIRRCRELGFSLDDVRTLLRIVDDNDLECRATRDLTIRHLTDVRGKIESLNRLERALTAMSDACQPGSQSSCPIINALSGAA